MTTVVICGADIICIMIRNVHVSYRIMKKRYCREFEGARIPDQSDYDEF